MIRYITLLFIGLAFWGCEEEEELILISPIGGEVWSETTTQVISWEGRDLPGFFQGYSIKVSYDNGENWNLLQKNVTNQSADILYHEIGDVQHNSGINTVEWYIPPVYKTKSANNLLYIPAELNCKISVRGNNDDYDESGNFTISLSDHIFNIVSPNGYETLHEQTTQEIIWYSTGDIGGDKVKIGYSIDGGLNWSGFVDLGGGTTSGTISDPPRASWVDVPNSGSYTWTLPNLSDPTNSCLIGIWSCEDQYCTDPLMIQKPNIYDTSDNYYSITIDSNYYQIIYPNGGEILHSGEEYQILWTSDGDVGSVEIYYSLFGGESWYLIDGDEANDGSFTWSVPSVQGTNDACKIKIQSRDRDDWFDVSDADFTISGN